jgi:hypothetical protein
MRLLKGFSLSVNPGQECTSFRISMLSYLYCSLKSVQPDSRRTSIISKYIDQEDGLGKLSLG